jgi:hypothetical protein
MDERKQSTRPLVLRFPIRESAEAPKVAPVGGSLVPSEALRQRAGRHSREILREHLAVIDPGLEVSGRSLDDYCRRKTLLLHCSHAVGRQIID